MNEYRLGEIEMRFACIIWENAPLPSGELVKLAEAELGWKKSTTYTVLRRLCDRGIFKNASGTVQALISREEFEAEQSRRFVDDNFGSSLPQFLAAFSRGRRLSEKDIAELQKLIDSMRG